MSELDGQNISDQVTLIDFDHAFLVSDPLPYKRLHTTNGYLAPELYTRRPRAKSIDLWAMASTIFLLRSGKELFDKDFWCAQHYYLEEMERLLGQLPPDMQSEIIWEGQFNLGNEPSRYEPNGLLEWVRTIGQIDPDASAYYKEYTRKNEKPFSPWDVAENPISEDEAAELTNLLRGLLKYRPEERMTAEEALEHPWFHRD